MHGPTNAHLLGKGTCWRHGGGSSIISTRIIIIIIIVIACISISITSASASASAPAPSASASAPSPSPARGSIRDGSLTPVSLSSFRFLYCFFPSHSPFPLPTERGGCETAFLPAVVVRSFCFFRLPRPFSHRRYLGGKGLAACVEPANDDPCGLVA